jgi:hypothetical protein
MHSTTVHTLSSFNDDAKMLSYPTIATFCTTDNTFIQSDRGTPYLSVVDKITTIFLRLSFNLNIMNYKCSGEAEMSVERERKVVLSMR